MQELTEKTLDEWKVSMENARHFNDLLIRFRMLGLPMVVMISVAGIAANQIITNIELWKWTMPFIMLVISVFGLIALFWHTIERLIFFFKKVSNKGEHERKQEPPLPIYWLEFSLWTVFITIVTFFAISSVYNLAIAKEPFILNNTATYSITPVALIFAWVLLIALYFMDRFYYYKLLIGAISRLVVLEKRLEFKITETTSEFMPRKNATNLITLFYLLPGIMLLIITGVSLNV